MVHTTFCLSKESAFQRVWQGLSQNAFIVSSAGWSRRQGVKTENSRPASKLCRFRFRGQLVTRDRVDRALAGSAMVWVLVRATAAAAWSWRYSTVRAGGGPMPERLRASSMQSQVVSMPKWCCQTRRWWLRVVSEFRTTPRGAAAEYGRQRCRRRAVLQVIHVLAEPRTAPDANRIRRRSSCGVPRRASSGLPFQDWPNGVKVQVPEWIRKSRVASPSAVPLLPPWPTFAARSKPEPPLACSVAGPWIA